MLFCVICLLVLLNAKTINGRVNIESNVDVRSKNGDIFQSIEDNNEKKYNAAHHMTGNDKLVESDIVETPAVDAQIYSGKLQLSDATSSKQQLWRRGFVPYTFERGVSKELKKAVYDAANDFRKYTCINFQYVRPSRIKKYKNYAKFIEGYGCYSVIGRQWGKQEISLGYGCQQKAVAIHEMMHALGMWHEQSRTDRDDHIKILRKNIKKGMAYNFNKYEHGMSLGEPYDEVSIMHYGPYAFSKNGRKTIVNLHKWKGAIGQRVGFSFIDIRQLNKLYKCSKKKILRNRRKRRRKRKNRRKKKVCKDEHKHCPAWKRDGYCKVRKFVAFMKKSCRKSCGYCR